MKLSGEVKYSIRFDIKDVVALVKAYPKEWRELTKEHLHARGHYGEVDRFPVFLDDLLETRVDVFGNDPGGHVDFRIDWDDTDYRWGDDEAAALMEALPPELRFEEGEPVVPNPTIVVGPNDVPLPGI